MDLTIDASGDAEDEGDVDNNRWPSSPRAVLYFEEAAGNAQR